MVGCCVPNCKSQQGQNKRISFHEFPINASAKEKWLGNIVGNKRENRWISTERGKVCSRHFVDTDYSLSTTKRRLLPHAVPSQFPDAPSDSDTSPRRHPWWRDFGNPATTGKCRMDGEDGQPRPVTGSAVRPAPAARSSTMPPSVKRAKFAPLITCVQSLASSSKSLPKTPETAVPVPVTDRGVPRAGLVFQDVGVQVDCRTSRRSCPDDVVKIYKAKFRGCKRQMHRLERRVVSLKERLAESTKLQPNLFQHKKVDAIVRSANEGNRRANFLLEQINSFGQKKPRWQPDTVRLCTAWQQRYPKGYKFVRNANLLSLPHPATIKRFEENTVRFEEAAPLLTLTPKSPDCQQIPANDVADKEPAPPVTSSEDTDEFAPPPAEDDDHVMLIDKELQSVADHHLPDHRVVPLSLLNPRQLAPMSELSLANQELIRNFLLAHGGGGGHVTLAEVDGEDGVGSTCCLVQDVELGVEEPGQDGMSLPAHLLATEAAPADEGDLPRSVDRCSLGSSSAFERLMLADIGEGAAGGLTKGTDGPEGRAVLQDDDLLPGVGGVFCSDGDAILEL